MSKRDFLSDAIAIVVACPIAVALTYPIRMPSDEPRRKARTTRYVPQAVGCLT